MKLNKILLSLGSITAAAAPIATAMSCGSILSSDKMEGPQVGWNDKTRTVYFNLFNHAISTSKYKTLDAFVDMTGVALQGGANTLEIAQKFEQAAGYSVNELGKVDNPQNAKKIEEGETVHVVMGAQHYVWRQPDQYHSTKWREAVGYHLDFSFPFHTLENTVLDLNAKSDQDAFDFYTAYKPWNIHTNFLKALNIVLAIKLGKPAAANTIDVTSPSGSTSKVPAMLSNENDFKKTVNKEQTGSDTSLILWNNGISLNADASKMDAVYNMYNNKEIALTEAEVSKIYNQSIS